MDFEKLSQELLEALCDLARTPLRGIKGISGGELGTMGYLMNLTGDGGAAPTDISRFFGISTARVASILRQLEKKGLVERRGDPDDGRRARIFLTEAGRALESDHTQRMLRDMRRLMEELGQDDAETVLRLARRLAVLCRTCPLESVSSPYACVQGGIQ